MSEMFPTEVLKSLASAKSEADVTKILAEYAENKVYTDIVETLRTNNKLSGEVTRENATEFVKSLVEVSNQCGLYISGKSLQSGVQHSVGFVYDDMDISLRVTVKN